jgi:predicted O-methyltransferase YrrM
MTIPDELQRTWTDVDSLAERWLGVNDDVLERVLASSARAGLPAINVSPCQGRLLNLLARIRGATRILEVGTLGGYSTIWFARALPAGGRVVTLEINAEYAALASEHFRLAGVDGLVEVRVGAAIESLAAMRAGGEGPFDLVFIDADKPNNAAYLEAALSLTRPGSVIVVDNIVRRGALLDDSGGDESVRGSRAALAGMTAANGLSATLLQTVGSKGYDGFTVALVEDRGRRPAASFRDV